MKINLNIDFIKCVLTLYHEMLQNGISLVYMGEFNQQIITMFTSMTKNTMQGKNEDKIIQRRVYHAMVETLENLNQHSDDISKREQLGKGFVIIGKKDDNYYIITSNKTRNEKKNDLKPILDTIFNSSREELTKMYYNQIQKDSHTDTEGTGLGLIDIARKTHKKLAYLFLPLDDEHSAFILKVEINSEIASKIKEND